jgi:hypothetical protein
MSQGLAQNEQMILKKNTLNIKIYSYNFIW